MAKQTDLDIAINTLVARIDAAKEVGKSTGYTDYTRIRVEAFEDCLKDLKDLKELLNA